MGGQVTVCRTGSVLLVEDDPLMCDLLKERLKQMGFTVLNAENGMEALIALETFNPDIIITDLMMPLMDGFELTRTVRKNESPKGVPIIAMSASVCCATKVRALEAGANEFLPKPFDVSQLEACMERHLSL